jgi:hypothetical protein
VDGLYRRLLGRPADPVGIALFVNLLRSGAMDEQVEAIILDSDEYFQHVGGTNSAFVTALYQDVLGRGPDPAAQFFLNALAAGAPRSPVALQIRLSTERVAGDIGSYYQVFVGRQVFLGRPRANPRLRRVSRASLARSARRDSPA